MSLEQMVAAMSCLLSACGNNNGIQYVQLMKNSVIARPLDDIWGVGCRAKAVEFSDKLNKLLKDQLNATAILSELEQRVTQLKDAAVKTSNTRTRRSKRELAYSPDDMRYLRFDCNGKQKIQVHANISTSFVDCWDKYYEYGWKLIASLDAMHRKRLSEKNQHKLIKGYENWERVNAATGDYFIGLEHLHAITTSKGAHELLILIHDQQHSERMVGESVKHIMHYNSFAVADASNDYRLLSLDGYEGDLLDPFKAMLGQQFSLAQIDMEDTDRVTIFVRSEDVA